MRTEVGVTASALTRVLGEPPIRPLSWHSNPDVKADAVLRMKAHREADRFMQGGYVVLHDDKGEPFSSASANWKGCFHGCLTAEALAEQWQMTVPQFVRARRMGLNTSHHSWWEEGELLWGIHRAMGMILDNAFEWHTTPEQAGDWAVAVTEAIPIGVDLFPLAVRLTSRPFLPEAVLRELATVS